MCVIFLNKYDEKLTYSNSELRKPLEEKYNFATKGTICVFNIYDGDLDELERDEYHAIKIHSNKLDILPSKLNKQLTITFKPTIEGGDKGDYVINPFVKMDGKANISFYEFLSTVDKNSVVNYPMIIDGMYLSWFRYVSNKIYNVEL